MFKLYYGSNLVSSAIMRKVSCRAVLAQRLNQTRPAADPDITELAGVIVDKYFQFGRAVARVDMPVFGLETLEKAA